MKSQLWLLDPRPNLPTIVRMVEKGFELSEASNTPVMLELRIRACHVHGAFETKDNRAPRFSRRNTIEDPEFDFARISLPPATYAQEKHKVHGKDFLPPAGEYTGEVVLTGVAKWLAAVARESAGVDVGGVLAVLESLAATKRRAAELLGGAVPARPPGFCIGCPERPVFSAMKLIERESGAFHISADIGCHTFSTLPPFNIGNTVLGYGLGLASNSGIAPMFGNRTVTIMGDGGFWHNGLTSGIANAVFNKSDGILVIMKNGYTSATGTQNITSSLNQNER